MVFFDIDETLFDNAGSQNYAAQKLYNEFSDLKTRFREATFSKVWSDVTEKYILMHLANKMSFQEQRRYRLREIFQKNLRRR